VRRRTGRGGLQLLNPDPSQQEPVMKRFHVHAHVENLAQSVGFYSKLFGAEPTRVESDYAKWMLDDPRINFAISTRGGKPGVDHLGLQTDSEEELVELKERARAADLALLDEGETTCCYARSDKYWLTDPQGIAWEQFHTLGNIPVFSEKPPEASAQASACCTASAPRGKPLPIPVKAASSCC
jgi:lactoylglutathione lyase